MPGRCHPRSRCPNFCQACIIVFCVLGRILHLPPPPPPPRSLKYWFLLNTEHDLSSGKASLQPKEDGRVGRRPTVDPDSTGSDNLSMSRFLVDPDSTGSCCLEHITWPLFEEEGFFWWFTKHGGGAQRSQLQAPKPAKSNPACL